jgi:hypothetical protein
MRLIKFLQLLLLGSTVLLFSCGRNGKSNLHINTTGLYPESVEIKQYGKALFEIDTSSLQQELKRLKPDFIHFLDADLSDSSNLRQIYEFVTDTQLIKLNNKSLEVFANMKAVEQELTLAYRRFHYHFPEIILPAVYTYISGVQYELPVMYADGIAVVAIDCYLGADFDYYQMLGIPAYMTQRMTPGHLLNDLFKTLYMSIVDQSLPSLNILDEMILTGKRLYFQEAMQPGLADNVIIGYSPEQYQWVERHEAQLWAYLVGEELLYSNDFQAFRRMFGDGPFSGDFSREAPSRLGEWVGWRIVRAYMKQHTDKSIAEMLRITDSQQILTGSKYRPK